MVGHNVTRFRGERTVGTQVRMWSVARDVSSAHLLQRNRVDWINARGAMAKDVNV